MTPIYFNGRPKSTAFRAAQIAMKKYFIDPKTGRVYNKDGFEIGGQTYEPRVTVHLDENRKYGIRTNKLVGYVAFGPEALRRGVSVRHTDGNKFNNRAQNLSLHYSRDAAKAYRRRLRENALA